MYIKLANKAQLNLIGATGAHKYVQGANRDTITFEFDDTYSVDELRAVFTEENCETINIVTEETVTDENENTSVVTTDNIHEGYVIRAEVGEKIKEITPATGTEDTVTETRIYVTMAQRTYAETQMVELWKSNELLEECILELSSAVYTL